MSIRLAVVIAFLVTALSVIFLGYQVINQSEFKGRFDFELKHKESQLKMGIERE